MVFLYLLTDRPDKARALLDKDLRAYIDTYRRVMSSKERILCAMALHLDGAPPKPAKSTKPSAPDAPPTSSRAKSPPTSP